MPSLSNLPERVGGAGATAWDIHSAAVAARERGEDVVVLSVGDPNFDTPAAIRNAAKFAIDSGDTHYVEVRGRRRLRELIAEKHQRDSGQPVDADNVVVVPGAQCGLFCSSMCVAGPGDRVVTTNPVYTTYEATMQAQGAIIDYIPLQPDNGFAMDADALAASVSDDTRALFITNPNNPTGHVLTETEMSEMVRLACKHDFWIISDEVYSGLVYDGDFRHFASFEAAHDRVISVSSLSKTFAMTGWRVGWIIAPKQVAMHIENILLAMLYGMPGFTQQAAITALTECNDATSDMREIYRSRRDRVVEALDGVSGIRCVKPMGGMFLMADIRETGLSSRSFIKRLYDTTGVSVMDGSAFGSLGEGFLRLSFTSSDEALDEGCRRIAGFLRDL